MSSIIVSNVPNTFSIAKLIETFSQCGNIISVNTLTTQRNGRDNGRIHKYTTESTKFYQYKIVYESTINLYRAVQIIETPVDGYFMVMEEAGVESTDDFYSSRGGSSIQASISSPTTVNRGPFPIEAIPVSPQEVGMRSYNYSSTATIPQMTITKKKIWSGFHHTKTLYQEEKGLLEIP